MRLLTLPRPFQQSLFSVLVTLLLASSGAVVASAQQFNPKGSYYTEKPLFLPHPEENGRKKWEIKHVGPIGIGVVLENPAFVMKINRVDPGSPAATAQLQKGQVIERINGEPLKDRDPRIILGELITEAEATDGIIRFDVRDVGEVVVQLPVLGAYSDTWPVNCPKSDKIVRQLAEVLAKQEKPGWGSVLFLLSTGEDRDLEVVKRWMQDVETMGTYPWHVGMKGLGICEYYLRTGDPKVLPVIEAGAEQLKSLMYNGGWSGRGHAQITYSVGSGHLNAAGVPACAFLMLAKYCGAEVDDWVFKEALHQFYRYAGHDNVGYGANFPEGGFRDNGKTAALAVAMQGAARLAGRGEDSVYAKAANISGIKSMYASNWFNSGHTGGGIGEMWHNVGIGMVKDQKPAQYRSYLDSRRWHMELSRRFDGSIGIVGGERYDVSATDRTDMTWGTIHALIYTLPRQQLQIFGAPATRWCQTADLPERPWGTPADDVFLSLEPATLPSGNKVDYSNERFPTHGSLNYLGRAGAEDVTDETLMEFAHHFDHGIRTLAVRNLVGKGRKHLVLPLLQSPDPRVRHAGLLAIVGMFKGRPIGTGDITPEMIREVEKMIENPEESLWVALHAMQALEKFPPQVALRHKDRLLEMLQHRDWWVRQSAVTGLSQIIAHPTVYREVIPPVASEMSRLMVDGYMYQFLNRKSTMSRNLAGAPPQIKAFAAEHFTQAHMETPVLMQAAGGHIVNRGASVLRQRLGDTAQMLQGNESLPPRKQLLTSKYRTSLDPSDLYDFTGRFIPNRLVPGTWKEISSAKSPEDIEEAVKKPRKPKRPATLVMQDRGLVGDKPPHTALWTGNAFIDIIDGEARKMGVVPYQGKPYLLIESGNFDPGGVKNDWSPGYRVFEKIK